MSKYMVIATVNKVDYLTKVEAYSACGAEHIILDQSAMFRSLYGVEGCQAYDFESMQTENFATRALWAEPVSLLELIDIINKRNAEIIEIKEATELIERNERAIKKMMAEIEEAKKILNK